MPVQDTERGRQGSMATLLAEVSERAGPKPSREEAERLRLEVRGVPCPWPALTNPLTHPGSSSLHAECVAGQISWRTGLHVPYSACG